MAPCGKRFRSNVEIDNYISAKKSKAIKTSSKKMTAKSNSAEDTGSYKEYLLPYDWKKVALKSKNSDRWDFHVLSPQGKKFRSNIEIRKYLEVNPDIKCDRNVTNTSKKMVQIDSVSDKESEEEGLEYVPKKGKRGPPTARSAISAKKVANEELDTESDKESEEEFPKNRKRRAKAVKSAIINRKSKVTESSSKKTPAKKSNSIKSDSESEEESEEESEKESEEESEKESEEESDKESEEEELEYVSKIGKRGPPAARSAIPTKKVAKKPQLGN